MKKQYLFFLLLASSIIAFTVYSCQKGKIKSEDATITTTSTNGAEKSARIAASAENGCTCAAGYSKCEQTCSVSNCCVCCPSGRACAAGCYFGIASCKCEGGESASAIASRTLKTDNMDKVMVYFEKELKVKTEKLQSSYAALKAKSVISVENFSYGNNRAGHALKFTHKDFAPFELQYREFISGLTIEQQEQFSNFLSTL